MKSNNKMAMYLNIEEDVPAGASFEQKWYDRIIMVLGMIRCERLDPVTSHKLLLKIGDDMCWVKNNINPKLDVIHRDLIVLLFDSSIELIEGCIVDKDLNYLDIVIDSMKCIALPYNRQ